MSLLVATAACAVPRYVIGAAFARVVMFATAVEFVHVRADTALFAQTKGQAEEREKG